MSRGDYAAHQGLGDTAAEHERVMRVLAPRPETLRDVRERHELLADLGDAAFGKALERTIGRAALWVLCVSLALLGLMMAAHVLASLGYITPKQATLAGVASVALVFVLLALNAWRLKR